MSNELKYQWGFPGSVISLLMGMMGSTVEIQSQANLSALTLKQLWLAFSKCFRESFPSYRHNSVVLTSNATMHHVAELIKETADDADFSKFHGGGRHVTDVTEWTVKFLRRQSSTGFKFVYPQADQISDVPLTDFVLKLPPPDTGVKRHITFANVDFAMYNLS